MAWAGGSRSLDLQPGVWKAFGFSSYLDWGLRTVNFTASCRTPRRVLVKFPARRALMLNCIVTCDDEDSAAQRGFAGRDGCHRLKAPGSKRDDSLPSSAFERGRRGATLVAAPRDAK